MFLKTRVIKRIFLLTSAAAVNIFCMITEIQSDVIECAWGSAVEVVFSSVITYDEMIALCRMFKLSGWLQTITWIGNKQTRIIECFRY